MLPVSGNFFPFSFHGTFLSAGGYWPLSIRAGPFWFRGWSLLRRAPPRLCADLPRLAVL